MKRVYLDTETTGLRLPEAAICEIAIADQNGTELLNTLVNPEKPIPKQATDIHGITDEMVASAPTLPTLMNKIRNIVLGNELCIYNVDYDTMFFPMWVLHGAAQISCVMKRYAAYDRTPGRWKGYKWHKLVDAAKACGYEFKDAHRAMADVKATIAVNQFIDDKEASVLDELHEADISCNVLREVCSRLRYPLEGQKNSDIVDLIEQYLNWEKRFGCENYVMPNSWTNSLLHIPF